MQDKVIMYRVSELSWLIEIPVILFGCNGWSGFIKGIFRINRICANASNKRPCRGSRCLNLRHHLQHFVSANFFLQSIARLIGPQQLQMTF